MALHLLLFAALAMVVARGTVEISRHSEPNFGNDAPRHMMTAVFWCDIFRARPVADPSGFAYAYYGHYPAIAPLHWPPLMHMIMGALFAVTGPSVVLARAVILTLTVLLLLGAYRLARTHLGAETAALATILLAGTSGLQTFSAVFMLEIPCMLWMVLSVLALGAYVKSARPVHIWTCSACAVAAILTKEHSIIVAPVLLVGVAVGFRGRHWRRVHTYLAPVLGLLIAGGYYGMVLSTVTSRWQAMSYQVGNVSEQLVGAFWAVGPILVVLAAVGTVTTIVLRRTNWLLIASAIWIAATLAFYFSMGVKCDRYLYYVAIPASFLAAWVLTLPGWLGRARAWATVALIIPVCLYQMWQVPHLPLRGYELAAKKATELSEGRPVVFGGTWDGPFILFRRLQDDQLRSITFRASKLFAGGNIIPERDYQAFVASPEEISQRFGDVGARVVVLEQKEEIDCPEHRWFWNYVATGPFDLVETIPTVYPNRKTGSLRIFTYRGPLKNVETAKLPMLTLKKGQMEFDMTRSLLHWGTPAAQNACKGVEDKSVTAAPTSGRLSEPLGDG